MARLSNDLDVSKIIGITGEAQKLIEGTPWIVIDAGLDFEYEDLKDDDGNVVYDDKGNKKTKKTDSVKSTSFLLSGPQDPKASKLVRNKVFKVKSAEAFTEEQCNYFLEEQPLVHVKIDRCTPWVGGSGNFRKVELSIYVRLYDENGAEVTSDDLQP